ALSRASCGCANGASFRATRRLTPSPRPSPWGRGSSIPRGRNHHGEQLHRQADDVRFTSVEDVHPAQPVLVSKRPDCAFPLVAFEILVQLRIAEPIHSQSSDCQPGVWNRIGIIPQAQPAEYAMFAATK